MDDIKLTPTWCYVERTVNCHVYKFWVDAYTDQNGETYYKGSSLLEIEKQIKEMENEKNLTEIG